MHQSVTSHSQPVVALMTDFGLGDGDVGVMKGVITGITSNVHIIDITHDVAPQSIVSGAWILASAYRYFPPNTVFVCVVDPGVGSSRSAIAVHAGNWFFVGPDNGLFSYVLTEQQVYDVRALSNPAFHLAQVSSTFHGRDIFAPVGAHLARGIAFSELGNQLDPTALLRVDIENTTRQEEGIKGQIIHVDRFGNLITSIALPMVPDLFRAAQVRIVFPAQNIVVDERRRFFADGADDERPFIYGDSSGYVGIAVRNGNAAKKLNVGFGTTMTFFTTAE